MKAACEEPCFHYTVAGCRRDRRFSARSQNPMTIRSIFCWFTLSTLTALSAVVSACEPAATPSGSGAAAAVGGGPGTGGAGPVVPDPGTTFGFRPNLAPNVAPDAYQRWRGSYVESCPNGTVRVVSRADESVSEGIGYGLLLTVIYDAEPTAFDGLWRYYNLSADPITGLMPWRVTGCEASVTDVTPASDAELDVAMALILASCKWGGNYAADATRMINAIQEHETQRYNNVIVLKPATTWGGATCMNPSYFSPAYYRAFALHVPEQAAFWNQFALDSYVVLSQATYPTTGLVPDWTNWSGDDGCTSAEQEGGYGYDAARTPWRIALDHVWWGTPESAAWLATVTNWVAANGIANVVDGYELVGTPVGTAHNSVFVGAFAVGAMTQSQALVDQFTQDLLGINDTAYFQLSTRALYLATLAGHFNRGCR